MAFQSNREGNLGIWLQRLGGEATRLTTAARGTSHAPESWFGDTLMYSVTRNKEVTLRTINAQTGGDDKPFQTEPSSAPIEAVFSPDGHHVAYTSTVGTKVTLYVQGFPTGPWHSLTAKASDTPKHPRWLPNNELCYDPSLRTFACVPVTMTPFAFGLPKDVPKNIQLSPPGTRTPYDVTPDGHFVAFNVAGQTRPFRFADTEIAVVLNWFEELKARAPRR